MVRLLNRAGATDLPRPPPASGAVGDRGQQQQVSRPVNFFSTFSVFPTHLMPLMPSEGSQEIESTSFSKVLIKPVILIYIYIYSMEEIPQKMCIFNHNPYIFVFCAKSQSKQTNGRKYCKKIN
jgi:hypothetical protein